MTLSPAARQGVLIVLSSPSGAGKTTLARMLLEADREIALSVSVTTRAMRPGEVDGRDYVFITREAFARRRDNGELLEWAEVHGNFYGTPKGPIETHIARGRDVLFDIDWQGAQQLRERAAAPVASIFILPPSAAELRARLERRAQDSPEVVARRIKGAAAEIPHWQDYDYVIVNTVLAESFATLRAIITAERVRRRRQMHLSALVSGMVADLESAT